MKGFRGVPPPRAHRGSPFPGADPQCDAGWLGELAARVAEGALADRLMDKAELNPCFISRQ